jgi:hypothetical protein
MIKKFFLTITIFVLFVSCTKQTQNESILKETSIGFASSRSLPKRE